MDSLSGTQPLAYTDLSGLQALGENKDAAALKKVSQQFESMFINMLMKNMRQANAVFEQGNFGHSNAEKLYRDMYDQQLSVNIASGRGLGIADLVYRQLSGDSVRSKAVGDLDMNRLINSRRDSAAYSVEGQSPQATAQPTVSGKASVLNETGSPENFVDGLLPIVSRAAERDFNPLVLVAQSALETGWGKHIIKDQQGNSSNNLFNIKAFGDWSGHSVAKSTLEFFNGLPQKVNAHFRSYETIEQSIRDYLSFIEDNPRYQNAVKHASNAEDYLTSLQQAGYATDPNYAQKVLTVLSRISAYVQGR